MSQAESWHGRRAVVVGAQGGVGSLITQKLRERGAHVVAMVRKAYTDPAKDLQVVLSPLADQPSVAEACRQVARGPVDALFVASGAYAGGSSIEATPPDVFERLLWTNARLPYYLLQGLLGPLRDRKGRAVLIGALAAEDPRAGQAAYAMSKAALHSMVRSAARELQGSGATINALLPSVIDGPENRDAMPRTDPALWVSPERLADLSLSLAEASASDLQGALIPVRGGL
jgi:NAD(P)-dependent dehydrogenase (short-subunit alcohol dehydrogenase family)